MRTPSAYEQQLGRYIRRQFGQATKVIRYGDDHGTRDMFLVIGEDCPQAGITSFGTVGLSQRAQQVGAQKMHVELLGACASGPHFDNVMASCVFDSFHNHSNIVYGAFIENILDQYQISTTLRHVTFVAPFFWQGLSPQTIEGIEIHWLLVVPISDAELDMLKKQGIEKLENLFEQKQIDLFDMHRASL